MQVVERWILAALRNRQFFSLDELNSAISVLLERLNRRPFRKLPGSRHSAFEALDRPALRPLPEQPYVYAEWKKARVHIDCPGGWPWNRWPDGRGMPGQMRADWVAGWRGIRS